MGTTMYFRTLYYSLDFVFLRVTFSFRMDTILVLLVVIYTFLSSKWFPITRYLPPVFKILFPYKNFRALQVVVVFDDPLLHLYLDFYPWCKPSLFWHWYHYCHSHTWSHHLYVRLTPLKYLVLFYLCRFQGR